MLAAEEIKKIWKKTNVNYIQYELDLKAEKKVLTFDREAYWFDIIRTFTLAAGKTFEAITAELMRQQGCEKYKITGYSEVPGMVVVYIQEIEEENSARSDS